MGSICQSFSYKEDTRTPFTVYPFYSTPCSLRKYKKVRPVEYKIKDKGYRSTEKYHVSQSCSDKSH